MKIETVKNTARRLSKVMNCYVSVMIDFSVYGAAGAPVRDKLDYSYYIEHESHRVFPTAQELNKAMNDRIKMEKAGPQVDELDGEV